ncbi:MAG: PadR family transcriptional regulator [Coriobacteriia bacterium]|nr:PadR family transcriptional regulator [Coriobacteriia bacterium]
MDAQLKKGVLEVLVLSVISRQDSYGYQIVNDMSKYIETSESTLYPILKRLESQGSISTYSIEHNGRLRKYYKIAPNGLAKIDEFLRSWPEMLNLYEYIKEGRHA